MATQDTNSPVSSPQPVDADLKTPNKSDYDTGSDFDISLDKKIEAGKIRARVVKELVETEKTYVNCLDNLINHFMNPLRNKINGKMYISSSEHSIMFPSDINTIYGFHLQLLDELEKITSNWDNNNSKIGNIFVKYGQLFKMYQNYMNNHEKAAITLSALKAKNNKFADWCNKQRSKCNNYGLDSLLILPIQRIPRYQLLLKELIKRTEQYDKFHSDIYDLKNAFDSITEVTTIINERMKENDARQAVTEIEKRFNKQSIMDVIGESLVIAARYFIEESSDDPLNDNYILKHTSSGTQYNIVIFVFNDCLIYGHHHDNNINASNRKRASSALQPLSKTAAKPIKSVKNLFFSKDLLKFGHKISFNSLFRIEDVPETKYRNLFCLKIYGKEHSLWISFKNRNIKTKWMITLTEVNAKYNSKNIKLLCDDNINKINVCFPLFIPDDYSDKCLICDNKFGLLNRRHHCYFCGNLICSKCSEYKLNSLWKKNEIVRGCKQCYNKYKNINKPPASPSYNLNDIDHSALVPAISISQPGTPIINHAYGMDAIDIDNKDDDDLLTLGTVIIPSDHSINIGTQSGLTDVINIQKQSKRLSLRRRKISDNKQNNKLMLLKDRNNNNDNGSSNSSVNDPPSTALAIISSFNKDIEIVDKDKDKDDDMLTASVTAITQQNDKENKDNNVAVDKVITDQHSDSETDESVNTPLINDNDNVIGLQKSDEKDNKLNINPNYITNTKDNDKKQSITDNDDNTEDNVDLVGKQVKSDHTISLNKHNEEKIQDMKEKIIINNEKDINSNDITNNNITDHNVDVVDKPVKHKETVSLKKHNTEYVQDVQEKIIINDEKEKQFMLNDNVNNDKPIKYEKTVEPIAAPSTKCKLLMIGGVVIIGIAVVVALKRKRIFS